MRAYPLPAVETLDSRLLFNAGDLDPAFKKLMDEPVTQVLGTLWSPTSANTGSNSLERMA